MNKITDKISKYLDESKTKPSYGNSEGMSYAVKIDDVPNDFFKLPFGRKIEYLRIIDSFKNNAKSTHIDAKGKNTMTALKNWVKMVKPKQFYAKWKKDTKMYKDDVVKIYYKE